MRAAIYVRISEDRTGEEAGIERQEVDSRRLVEHRDWTLVGVYPDNDLSATYGKARPEYEALMASVARGEVDRIVVYHTSRFWRNRRERADGIEVLKDARVSLVPVKGPELDMTTAYGRGMAGLVGEFDTMEVEVKSERQLRAIQQAVADGRRHGGRRRFGYGAPLLTEDGHPVIDRATGLSVLDYDAVREDEAHALADQYQGFVAGEYLASCARALNDLGLYTTQPTRTGGPSPWRGQYLGKAMRNPAYIGMRAVKIGPGKWREVTKAKWPAIIDEPTFRAAGSILDAPDRHRGGTAEQRMLTNVALCGAEGCTSHVHSGGNMLKKRAYRCKTTPHMMRQADPVDEYVSDVVVGRLMRDDAADLLLDRDREDMDVIQAEAAALRVRRKNLVNLVADGTFTDAEVRMRAEELDAQLEQLQQHMSDQRRMELLKPLIDADDVAAAWDALPEAKKGAVVDLLMMVTLLPPGRGTRTFREESVLIVWREFASP